MGRSVVWLALTGCQVVFPLDAIDALVIDAQDPDAPDASDARPVCTAASTTCYSGAGSASLECSFVPVAACDPHMFRYCDCGAMQAFGGLVALPNDTNPNTQTTIVYSTQSGAGGIDASISDVGGTSFFCAGNSNGCAIDQDACPGETTAYVWADMPRGPGSWKVKIYHDNPQSPCNAAGLLLSVTITR